MARPIHVNPIQSTTADIKTPVFDLLQAAASETMPLWPVRQSKLVCTHRELSAPIKRAVDSWKSAPLLPLLAHHPDPAYAQFRHFSRSSLSLHHRNRNWYVDIWLGKKYCRQSVLSLVSFHCILCTLTHNVIACRVPNGLNEWNRQTCHKLQKASWAYLCASLFFIIQASDVVCT